jgi:FkbM family methyltransferase
MIDDYEPWLISSVPEKGEVAIDVGANRGLWTRWLARRFEWVHAIEPNPEILPQLREGLPVNVTLHEIAAWDEERLLSFKQYACPDHLSAYFKDEGIATGPVLGIVEISAVPLDSFSILGKVDFIKCDTEGGEFRCILGAENLIARNRPVLLIEIHAAENFKRLSALLSDWCYAYRVIEHPLAPLDSPYRTEHFWIACQPQALG